MGKEVKIASLSFTRPSGLNRAGQGSQASKLGYGRTSGLCEDHGGGWGEEKESAHYYLQECEMINVLLGCLSKIR